MNKGLCSWEFAKCGAMNVNVDEEGKGERERELGIIYLAVAGETRKG